jgi:hypothetical protein
MNKNYTTDSVTADDNCGGQMTKLLRQGWKNLQYVSHGSWGDCSPAEIMGERPMTKKEIKEMEKRVKANRKDDIRQLKTLAKKLGFRVKKVE